eukprot:2436978-Ditylum_brightwellii.AAC.1
MVRLSTAATALAASLWCITSNAFIAPSNSNAGTTRGQWGLNSRSNLQMTATGAVTGDFTSEGAKSQIGNDSFLNTNLMARAQNGPGKKNEQKLKIGIVGAGLAGMVAAMDLADAGHEVEMFEVRPFVGGKVSSWQDKDGNHIEMGLH